MVDATTIVLISNTLIMGCTLIATFYRIRIENKQIKLTEKNTIAREALESLSKLISEEQDQLNHLTPEELKDFLETIKKLCKEV